MDNGLQRQGVGADTVVTTAPTGAGFGTGFTVGVLTGALVTFVALWGAGAYLEHDARRRGRALVQAAPSRRGRRRR